MNRKKKKVSLQSEYDFFVSKIERKLISYVWELIDDPCDVNAGVKSLELSLDEWFALNGKLHGLFSEGYVDKFEKKFHEMMKRISDKIFEGKLRNKELYNLRDEKIRTSDVIRAQDEQEKLLQEKQRYDFEKKTRLAEYKGCATNLYDEIKVLNSHLCTSCMIDLKGLSDHHLLDLKKNIANFTADLREILNKITSFSKLVPYCGQEGELMMEELSK